MVVREALETLQAKARAKVEHPFGFVKNLFGHKKARYRGLAKNTAQLMTLFALVTGDRQAAFIGRARPSCTLNAEDGWQYRPGIEIALSCKL